MAFSFKSAILVPGIAGVGGVVGQNAVMNTDSYKAATDTGTQTMYRYGGAIAGAVVFGFVGHMLFGSGGAAK